LHQQEEFFAVKSLGEGEDGPSRVTQSRGDTRMKVYIFWGWI